MKIWIDGQLHPKDAANVSVFDHGLLYGDGCFEGIRVYGGRILKLEEHLQRLFDSAGALRLEIPYTLQEVATATRSTVSENGLTDAYIRLVVTRGVGTLGLNPFLCPKASVIIIADKITLYPQELYDNGLPIIVAKRPRVPAKCLDPAIKSLNYLNNILAKVEAIDAGVLEALMLNTDGKVSECTGDNIFFVKDGEIVTPSVDAGILRGITRKLVIDTLAPKVDKTVTERAVELDEIFGADEVFLTGTAAEIIGVTKVDDRVIGDGSVGPVTRQLLEVFRAMITDGVPED